MEKCILNGFNDNYDIQWEMNHGSNPRCMDHDTNALDQLSTVIIMEKI